MTYYRKNYFRLPVFLLCLTALAGGCGFKKLATKTSAELFYDASPSIDREEDIDLAEQSSLGFFKMLEGFYLQNPRDEHTLFLLTKAYAAYAFGFTENHILASKGSNAAVYEKSMARAKRFYTRAKDYGIELLSLHANFARAKNGSLDDFKKAVASFSKKDIENLFWAAFAWGNYLNFNKDSVEAIAELPKVEVLMNRVLELDENYYYGGPHLFFGAFYGSRPALLGGDPEKSKTHFEKAIQLNQRKYLMAQVNMAYYYAVQTQDSALYKKLLREVESSDAAAIPAQRLSNELAKQRAKILLEKQSLFFSRP